MAIVRLSALAAMEAGCICTGQHLVFTVCPFKASWTHTPVAVVRIQAVASVATGLAVTLQVAVDPSEARQAGAGVAALTRVHARGPVGAGLVVGAVVQILVTKDASPALLAGALPWLCAGTMFTGRMKFTHITEESLPALSALALSR